jgi:TRAP-type mannitol/chloroaromatic compound transport system substrate-binding protein
MQTHWPPGVKWYKPIYEGYAKRVAEASNGEIVITPLPYNTVVPTKDMFEAVGRGVLDMAMSFPAYWVGKIPVAGHLNGQIFTWQNFEQMWGFLKFYGALDIIQQAYNDHGIQVISPVAVGPLGVYSKKKLETPEDFKGFKIRSTGIPAEVFRKMGATPVFFPGSELYQSLQTGVCEGAHWGGAFGGWEMKLYEVTSYYVQPNLTTCTNAEILINKKKFDKLPAYMQKVLLECGLCSNADASSWTVRQEIEALAKFQKRGGKISRLNDESVSLMKKYSLEVIDQYSKKDPKYCGKVGALLHEFLEKTANVNV